MKSCFISKPFSLKETLMKPLVVAHCDVSVSLRQQVFIVSTSSLTSNSKHRKFNLLLSPAPEHSVSQWSVNNWPGKHWSTKANRSILLLWALTAWREILLPFISYHRGPHMWINSQSAAPRFKSACIISNNCWSLWLNF